MDIVRSDIVTIAGFDKQYVAISTTLKDGVKFATIMDPENISAIVELETDLLVNLTDQVIGGETLEHLQFEGIVNRVQGLKDEILSETGQSFGKTLDNSFITINSLIDLINGDQIKTNTFVGTAKVDPMTLDGNIFVTEYENLGSDVDYIV